MQKAWANEPVTSVARYQLAMLHDKDNEIKAAVAQLEKLPPDFAGYIYAQGQLVFIALKGKEKAQTEDEKKAFTDAARRAILREREPAQRRRFQQRGHVLLLAARISALSYFDAAGQLNKKDVAKAQQTYAERPSSWGDLGGKLAKTPVKLSAETRDKLDFSLGVMSKYARLGLAEIDYRKGNYDQVLKSTDADVAAMDKKKGDGKDPIRFKDFEVTGDLLGLALRANVQKGNTARAKEILVYLDRLAGEGEGAAESTNVLLADQRPASPGARVSRRRATRPSSIPRSRISPPSSTTWRTRRARAWRSRTSCSWPRAIPAWSSSQRCATAFEDSGADVSQQRQARPRRKDRQRRGKGRFHVLVPANPVREGACPLRPRKTCPSRRRCSTPCRSTRMRGCRSMPRRNRSTSSETAPSSATRSGSGPQGLDRHHGQPGREVQAR